MAYNPTVWEENDLLSADRMNKIEQGIAEASETPDGLLPAGGTAGQVLAKTSDEDFAVEWTDVPKSITIDDVNTAIAEAVPDIIVESYNGRSGAVVPQSGDYTAEMVGAIANTNVSEITVLTEAEYDALTTKDATTLYLIPEE